MEAERMLSEELSLSDLSEPSGYSRDVSRLLLGLMALSRRAEESQYGENGDGRLGALISRPVLRSLLSALHFRDVATVRHSRRVAMLAVGMTQHLGWEPVRQQVIEVAALLHDIGKIGIPDNILFKPGKLSPEEADLMALHRNIGVDVLQACRVDNRVLEIVVRAHSDHNDQMQSFRRVGSEIPLGARILAVADAYDSLHTDQVYRKAATHEEIMKILKDATGTQFDGNVVCALSRWIESEGLPFDRPTDGLVKVDNHPGPAHPEEALEASSLGHIFSHLYVLESLYDGFYVVDSDMRFVVWNRGCERLIERSARETVGQPWSSQVFHYNDIDGRTLPADECALSRVARQGKAVMSTVLVGPSEDQVTECELQTVPLLDAEGRLHGVAEIFRDLSRSHRPHGEVRELKLAASRDSLTSVANRGELETQLSLMISEYSQQQDDEPFSVIFLDVDHFKSINDTYGHSVGDQVLVDVARLLQHETYSGELVGRYGGEEFVILCPATDMEQAVRRAERLRATMSRSEVAGRCDIGLTASFGVTEAETGDSVQSILRRADEALYMAKKAGRNRTCSLSEEEFDKNHGRRGGSTAIPSDRLVFSGSFEACVAADMIVYKLGGFVNDECAKLVEVTPKRAVIRLGSRSMFPFWRDKGDRQPVEMVVEFGEQKNVPTRRRHAASRTVAVEVRIHPLDSTRDADAFQRRARRIMKTLRSYFVAN